MEIALQLAKSIGGLFVFLVIGFTFVKVKLLKDIDAKTISKIIMFMATPAAIVRSFQVEFTPDRMTDLGLSFLGGILCQLIFMGVAFLLKKGSRFNDLERMSVAYPNVANLTIPLVTATLGGDWVLFTAGYSVIQNIFCWTHEITVISGQKAQFRKIILNVNILAIVVGILMFVFRLRMPAFVGEVLSMASSTLGPLSMFMIGMSIAAVSLREIFGHRRLYWVLVLRLIVCPIIIALLLRITGLVFLTENSETVFLITLIGAAGPVSAMTAQFAQLHDNDPAYAGAINLTSTLCCILTMPLMVAFYQFLLTL